MCSIRASVLIEAFLWQALYYPPCQKIQAMQKMTFSRAIHMIPWPLPCSSRPLVENMQKVIKQTIQHAVQLFLFSFSIFCLTSPVFYSHNLIICLSDFISQPEILILLAYFKHLKSIIQLSAPFFIFQCFFSSFCFTQQRQRGQKVISHPCFFQFLLMLIATSQKDVGSV